MLETALGSLLQLVHAKNLSMGALVDRLTAGPAKVLGGSYSGLGSLQPGTAADVVLFDPEQEWTVDTAEFESKGKNTPLDGTKLKGRVMATFALGRLVYQSPSLKFNENHTRSNG